MNDDEAKTMARQVDAMHGALFKVVHQVSANKAETDRAHERLDEYEARTASLESTMIRIIGETTPVRRWSLVVGFAIGIAIGLLFAYRAVSPVQHGGGHKAPPADARP